jgi:hypothetical protein
VSGSVHTLVHSACSDTPSKSTPQDTAPPLSRAPVGTALQGCASTSQTAWQALRAWADHCFPPAGRRFAVLALGRKSDLQQPRLPSCCCAAGQGETAPSLASQAPRFSGLWLRALERLSCTTLSGWTLWARQKCRGCALTPLAPLPLQSGRRGCAPADDHPVGRVARAVVPTGVIPPASRHRVPRLASTCGLGLGRERLRAGRPGPAAHTLRVSQRLPKPGT